MNNLVPISGIVIIYEILFLILYQNGLLNNISNREDLISWAVLPNIFIISVLYLVNCPLKLNTKIIVTIIKTILLVLILRLSITRLSFKHFILGSLILLTYFMISNINNVYNCKINNMELIYSFILSSILYGYVYLMR